jgi:hypothetical protein
VKRSTTDALGEGAAQEAPTAPHATPRRGKGPRTGPERFWLRWPVRLAFGASLVVSGLAHCTVMPIDFSQSFQIEEVDGEAAIPVDLLSPEDTPPPPPPPEEVKPPAEDDKGQVPPVATVRAHPTPDGGAPRDGGPDGARDAAPDAGVSDGAASDAGAGSASLDGAVAMADAGPGGPRDPQAIVGAAGDIQVDKVLVMVVVNAEVIRKSPSGPTLAALLRRVDQWDQFMRGTDIDPVKDIDWIIISGPSIQNTTRDVVLVHYSASDAKVDHAMDVVAGNYPQGGAFDAGVSMKAVRSFSDGAERVVLQPRPHVLAVVPTSAAAKVARQLATANVPAHVRKGEALYLRVVDPHHPMPQIPAELSELRLRIVPTDDDGADVLLDGDTASPEAARKAAGEIQALLQTINGSMIGVGVRFAAGDLLDGIEVTTQGNVVKVHMHATAEQIAGILGLAGTLPGVSAPPPAPSATRPHPAPSSSR